jgi:hypothetical protein
MHLRMCGQYAPDNKKKQLWKRGLIHDRAETPTHDLPLLKTLTTKLQKTLLRPLPSLCRSGNEHGDGPECGVTRDDLSICMFTGLL